MVDVDDYMKVLYQGLRHDIGTYGDLGNLPRGLGFKKLIKEAYDFKTEEEVEKKMNEYAYGFRQKKIAEERMKKIGRTMMRNCAAKLAFPKNETGLPGSSSCRKSHPLY